MRYSPICSLTLVLLGACSDDTASPEAHDGQLAHEMLVVDTHIDVPYRLHRQHVDLSQAANDGDFDYPRAVAGGLDVAFMSIYVPATEDEAGNATAFADSLIDLVEGLAADHPDKFQIATCAADVERIREDGRIALPMGMENGGPIAGDFANLRHFRSRGIRYITLAHSKSNHISDSSYDPEEQWHGLSPFGKELIEAMNDTGIMVDVSHISDAAFWQVIELSRVPVVATHSSLRHFTPGFVRNMSDDMVRALNANGGVIQINFGSGFLTAEALAYGDASSKAAEAFRAESDLAEDDPGVVAFLADYRKLHAYPYADLEDVLNHIDRAVALAGIDHVGIGSDYDGVGDSLPRKLKDVSAYPNLAAGLKRRGYDEAAIGKILGGNLMRVWRRVETHATSKGHPPDCRQASAP